jgi:hypothetical protein
VSAVRDSFAEALGAILALAVNPDAQVYNFCIFFKTFILSAFVYDFS